MAKKKRIVKKRKPVRVRKASPKKVFAVQEAMIQDLELQLMQSQSKVTQLEKDLLARAPKVSVWTTADGDTMPLSQMEDRHLQNTIFYLFRRLTSSFGSARYLDSMKRNLTALLDMMTEAEKRGLRV